MTKTRKYDLAIIILLCVISESDVFSFFLKNLVGTILDIVLRLLFMVYVFIKIFKKGYGKIDVSKPKLKWLLLLPIFVVTISNFIVCWVCKETAYTSIEISAITCVKIVLTILAEELAFRAILYKEISLHKEPLSAILISSLIFGAVHLLNINSLSSIPACAIQAVYSFGTGIVMSFLYYYSGSFIFPLTFHFCFNFFNNYLVTELYDLPWTKEFFIVNIAIAIVTGLYIFFLFYGGRKHVTKDMDI